MKKLIIAIALLSVCLFNAEADKKESKNADAQKQEVISDNAALEAANSDTVRLNREISDLKVKYRDLLSNIENYKKQVATYVEPLIECFHDTTPLDKVNIGNAEEAIKKYKEGAVAVDIINPRPEFDAPAAIQALRKRLEVAKEVQDAYAMLKRKYTHDERYGKGVQLMKRNKEDKLLTEEEKATCKNAADELATDEVLRGKFVDFISALAKNYGCIPTNKMALQARDELVKGFVNDINVKLSVEGDNVPETYALVHDIIAEMTKTLTNYKDKGKLSTEPAFQAWINNFVKQLSTK